MLRLVARVLRILNSEIDPGQIGGAVALAAVFGLTPLWTLHNLLLLLLVLLLRVNLSSFILAWGLFTLFAFALDPLFDTVGHAVLTAGPLQPLWGALYTTDLGRLSDFNNTVVMGSLVLSLLLAPLLHIGTVYAVRQYRGTVRAWMRDKPIYQLVRRTRLISLYETMRDGG